MTLQLSKYFPVIPATSSDTAKWIWVCAPSLAVCTTIIKVNLNLKKKLFKIQKCLKEKFRYEIQYIPHDRERDKPRKFSNVRVYGSWVYGITYNLLSYSLNKNIL